MKPVFVLDLTPAVVILLTLVAYAIYAGALFIRAVIKKRRAG